MQNKLHIFLIYVVLALTTIITFESVRHNEFVEYDDGGYITENPQVQAGLTWKSVVWAFTTPHGGISYWHPLTWLSHILDCELFGLNPLGHHLTNLFFHIANTLLLFWVLRRMTGAVWQSAFVAAVFALHPLNVESVAWVSERKNVLSTLFWLLTMAAYTLYVSRPAVGRYLLTLFVFALGLMAKPILVTLPFVLLLLDYWPLDRFQWKTLHRLIWEKIPFFILSAILAVVTFFAQRGIGTVASIEKLPLNYRIANALVSYIGYIGKMFYPSRLAVFYPHPVDRLPLWQPVVCLLILIVVSIAVIYIGRRRRYLLVGWLWYLGTLVPVIGLVQVGSQAMADRYMYLPLIGIFIIVAWGAAELSAKWRYRKVLLAVSAMTILLVFAICTRLQLRYWRNSITLFEHVLDVTKNNLIAHYNLGNYLQDKGRFDEAVMHYKEALRIDPQHFESRQNMGVSFLKQKNFEEAIACFNEALRIKPNQYEAIVNLGIALKEQGKIDKAIEEWERALSLEPDSPEAHYHLGMAMAQQGRYDEPIKHFNEVIRINPQDFKAHLNMGVLFFKQKRFDEAIACFNKAIQLKPDYFEAFINLGMALKEQDRLDEAIEKLKEALRLKPDHPGAHHNMALVMAQQGKYAEAIKHYEYSLELKSDQPQVHKELGALFYQQADLKKVVYHWNRALELEPEWLDVMNNLAWLRATHSDPGSYSPAEAVKLALRACEMTGYNAPEFLDTLAAAYAADGDFSKAIETAEKAIKLAEAADKKELAGQIRGRLQLYKAGQPYIEK